MEEGMINTEHNMINTEESIINTEESMINTEESMINTDMNIYSIYDLIELLNLDENYTKEDVIEKINFLNKNYFKNNEDLAEFFNNIQNKLISHFNDNLNENILPDYGSLIETGDNLENMENMGIYENNYDNGTNANNDNLDEKEDSYLLEDSLGYNEQELIDPVKSNIEYYNSYNYLHFNTLFRSGNNSLLDTVVPATNSNFVLSTPVNNVSRIKLASINIKKPYLICSSKSNNTFIIKIFKKNNIFDCSATILIEDGYYDNPENLVEYLNAIISSEKYVDSNIRNIIFLIDKNSNRVSFEYDNNSDNFDYFLIDFKSNYTKYYSLATILGFDYNKSEKYYRSIFEKVSGKYIIKSPYNYVSKGNTELFFCFDEFQSNIVETHKLFLNNNNMSTQKILAKIDCSLGTSKTKNYITEIYSQTDTRNDHTREYDGVMNLFSFNIKIIDYYGNIVNSDQIEDFTFTLEVKLNNARLIKDKYNNKNQ